MKLKECFEKNKHALTFLPTAFTFVPYLSLPLSNYISSLSFNIFNSNKHILSKYIRTSLYTVYIVCLKRAE